MNPTGGIHFETSKLGFYVAIQAPQWLKAVA